MFDTLIIGSGPAGIKAGVILKANGKDILMFEKGMPCGKVNHAPRVDNYPNKEPISGPDLALELFSQINKNDIPFKNEEVISIKKKLDHYIVKTQTNEYESKTILVASGTNEKKLDVPNEDKYFGHGLSYCAICDGHFFKDKVVAVVGEDKYAVNEALYLTSICAGVIYITKENKIKGETRLISHLNDHDNFALIAHHKVVELEGAFSVGGMELENTLTHVKSTFRIDGIFALTGYIPNTSFLPKTLLDKTGFLKVDKTFMSEYPGLFGAGDVLTHEIKQIYLSEIEGEKAANSILKYLNK